MRRIAGASTRALARGLTAPSRTWHGTRVGGDGVRGACERVTIVTSARAVALGVALGVAVAAASACEPNVRFEDHAFPQPVERIEIDGVSSEIDFTVAPTSAGAVLVERIMRWNHGEPLTGGVVEGGVLRLRSACDAPTEVCDASYTITSPLPVALRTWSSSGHGHVRAVGARGLEVARGDGGVELESISGEIEIETETGAVTGATLRPAECRVRTRAGPVGLAFARAPDVLQIETDSGDVAVLVPAGSYRLALTSERGAVELSGVEDEPRSALEITISTRRGDIEVRGVSD